MSLLLAAMLAAPPPVPIESIALRPVDGAPGIVVVAHRPLAPVVVTREGERLFVRIPAARLSPSFAGPRLFALRASARGADPSNLALQIRQGAGDVSLELRMPPDVPFRVYQDGVFLRFSFQDPEPGSSVGTTLLASATATATTSPTVTTPTVTTPVVATPAAIARAVAARVETAAPAPVPAVPVATQPAFAALRAPDALTVTVATSGPRALVRVSGGVGLADARVRREGGEVIVTLDVGADAVPASPESAPPVDDVHVEKVGSLGVIHVRVAPEVPFEVQRAPRLLTLVFGELALESLSPAPPPPPVAPGVDVNSLVTPEMYKMLFPATVSSEADRASAAASDLASEGLQVGPVHLRPSVLLSYVDGDYTLLDTPQPVSDHYLQVEPRVSADMPLLGGELTADYGVRLRYFSAFDPINTPSQMLNAGLQVPVGSRTVLRARDHFATGVLESTEVDPGQEYFFDLSRFRRNEVEVGARVEAGTRIFLDGSVGYNDVHFDDATSFFPYSERSARAGIGTTLGENLRAGVYYSYFHVPPPESRPVVESTGHAVGVGMEGDFGTLTRGEVRVDWQDETAPNAASGGQTYSGIAGQISLSRELSPSSRVTLIGRRATDLSAFEDNAFYVSTGGQGLLSYGLPWSLSANGSIGYQQNAYRTVASSIGAPREDTILGWTLGLSRPVGSFGYIRADYRRDRRRSNIPGFDVTTDGFIVQMGLGLFGTSVRR